MSNFHKNSFQDKSKQPIIGSFLPTDSLAYDLGFEMVFGKLEPGFTAAPHIHTQTKTVVVVLQGGMTFKIDLEEVVVNAGEYLIFPKGAVEEVVAVLPGTENLTIHTPSVPGGDKKEA